MDGLITIRKAVTSEILATALGLVAVLLALFLALSKGFFLILFFGLSAVLFSLLLANQLRKSLYQIQ